MLFKNQNNLFLDSMSTVSHGLEKFPKSMVFPKGTNRRAGCTRRQEATQTGTPNEAATALKEILKRYRFLVLALYLTYL